MSDAPDFIPLPPCSLRDALIQEAVLDMAPVVAGRRSSREIVKFKTGDYPLDDSYYFLKTADAIKSGSESVNYSILHRAGTIVIRAVHPAGMEIVFQWDARGRYSGFSEGRVT